MHQREKNYQMLQENAFVSVVNKLDEQMDANRAIKQLQLMMKAVGQRDMSAQEVIHQILSLN